MLQGIEVGSGDTEGVQLGTIASPNLKEDLIDVYEQSSSKKAGRIHSPIQFLQVPAGTYKLEIHGMEIRDNAVEAGQEVFLE